MGNNQQILKVLLTILVFSPMVLAKPAPAKKGGQTTTKIKDIPRLNVREEKRVSAVVQNLVLPAAQSLSLGKFEVKKTPGLFQLPITKMVAAGSPQKLVDEKDFKRIPVVKALNVVDTPETIASEPTLKNLVELKPDELKMLQALIFLEYQKKYDLAMSLFVELMDTKEYRAEALFHYAETAFHVGLYSEFRHKMIQLTQETKNQELKKAAAELLAKNVAALEVSDISMIDPLVESFDIDVTKNEKYLIKKAKYYSEKGDLAKVEDTLALIPEKSEHYGEASLLKAVANYRKGQVDEAIALLEQSWPVIEGNKKDSVRNLSALTLARMYFQKGKYKPAYDFYVKVDKSSGSWLQAMVEQAWTQILAGDYEGAAGNMFSLHSDFFMKAYSPDTYIVRTVGYLNLCQYGDGVSVLNDLKKRYSSVQEKLDGFQSKNKDPNAYYDLVKGWMKNTKSESVDGVPRAFIVELARHPNFTLAQKQINNYEDEISRFNTVAIDLIRKERDARLAMIKTKSELTSARSNKESESSIQRKEQNFLATGIEHSILSRARDGLKKMRVAAIDRLEKEKETLRKKAGQNLQARYKSFTGKLSGLIEQNDVLAYEIYSSAGEHIRFQMAGGDVQARNTASLAPSEKNSYKWKHRGEVWEDELGHYRSSLKNVCPADESIAQNQGGQ